MSGITIGKTHVVRVDSGEYLVRHAGDRSMAQMDADATEAVKRQIAAHENLLIAIGMGWDLDGVIGESRFALAPFATTHEAGEEPQAYDHTPPYPPEPRQPRAHRRCDHDARLRRD